MAERAAIILAAGQGTRMRSDLPKVLHKVGGRAMVDWSIDLARRTGCERIIVVLGPGMAALQAHVVAELGESAVAIQSEPLGTGHAVQAAEVALAGFQGDVVVLYGDTPLIPASAISALFHKLSGDAAVGVLGFDAAVPGAYGRLVTDQSGALQAIVEAKEASEAELAIRLCNSGVMACSGGRIFDLLAKVTNDNAKGEYYLTDLVQIAREQSLGCVVERCAEADVLGVNSRAELARAEAAFQARRRQELMEAGVTLVAPETVFLSHDTLIERDAVIEPNVVFGPGAHVRSGALIRAFSHVEGAQVHEGAEIGPYARLRPGAVIEEGARIGNFVEVKKTRVGRGAKANHLAYLGDGDISANANIGAGTIFCNYDGFLKHRTVVGEGAFIGSNSALVAPVRIGSGAIVGSGSVITDDVEPEALALGRARQSEKRGWARGFRERMTARKAGKSAKET